MKLLVTGVLFVLAVQSVQVTVKEPFFLMTASVPRSSVGGHILRMNPETFQYSTINFTGDLYNPIAVDFDPVEETIYWSEVGQNRRIRRASVNGGVVYTVMEGATYSVIDGLAVDPANRLIFYSDTGKDVIGRISIPRNHDDPRIIIDSQLDEPRAIVLHTRDKVMFWTDWGKDPKIERANYDGTGRRTLINSGLYFVNALALDVHKERLYWLDAGTDNVEESNLEGFGRQYLLRAASQYHFFGLALYDDALYITDWGQNGTSTSTSHLVRVKLDGKEEGYVIKTLGNARLNDIHAYEGEASRAHCLAPAGWSGTLLLAPLIAFIAG